jgi:hypothetical protein
LIEWAISVRWRSSVYARWVHSEGNSETVVKVYGEKVQSNSEEIPWSIETFEANSQKKVEHYPYLNKIGPNKKDSIIHKRGIRKHGVHFIKIKRIQTHHKRKIKSF